MAINLTQCIHRAVQQTPDRVATIFGERRRTYRQLVDRVSKLAGAMRAMGIGKGDRVGILSLNSDRYLETYLAVFWLGAVVNPANTRWSASELAYSFNDCDTTTLFVGDEHCALVEAILEESPRLVRLVHLGESPPPVPMLDYETLVADAVAIGDAQASNDDLAAIFYTGGTTGFPKGVMLSHTSLMGASLNRMALGYGLGPVYLHAAPVFHLAGALGIFWQFIAGGTHVILPSFTAKGAMQSIETEKATDTLLVPTMLQMILDHPDFTHHDLSSLRFLVYGASPITEALLDRMTDAFPALAMMQGYGMTELAGPVTYLPPYYHTPQGRLQGKLRSAGRAAAMAEVRIVDTDGIEVPRGTVGEIAARGMSNMLGYWNRPTDTEKTLRDGWVHSGDGAYMDDEGFVFIVDRMKDMIVSGGENVYSAEVENAVNKHPAVGSSAVIGVPSERWGEAVHAVVVLKAGRAVDEATLIAHCKTLIAGYKCPRSVEFRLDLPLSGAGKVLKNKLRDPFWEGTTRRVN